MTTDGRIELPEVARRLGLSPRQVRRYRDRLGAKLELRTVVQPRQQVLTFSASAVDDFKAEREGRTSES